MFNKWLIKYNIEEYLFLDKLIDDKEGLSIILSNIDKPYLSIRFSFFYGYRNFDESYRLKILDELNQTEDSKGFFFVSEKSEFIDWFEDESYTIYQEDKKNHYMIFTQDSVIDVISDTEPIITLFEN